MQLNCIFEKKYFKTNTVIFIFQITCAALLMASVFMYFFNYGKYYTIEEWEEIGRIRLIIAYVFGAMFGANAVAITIAEAIVTARNKRARTFSFAFYLPCYLVAGIILILSTPIGYIDSPIWDIVLFDAVAVAEIIISYLLKPKEASR